MALDTLDFWVGNLCIYVMATVQVILFGWVLGIDRGMAELHRGAEIRIPRLIGFVIKYLAPLFLLSIFAVWLVQNAPGRVKAIFDSAEGQPPVVALSVGLIVLVAIFFGLLTARSNQRWE